MADRHLMERMESMLQRLSIPVRVIDKDYEANLFAGKDELFTNEGDTIVELEDCKYCVVPKAGIVLCCDAGIPGAEYVLKLAYFNLVLVALYHLAFALLFARIGEELNPALPLLMLVGSVIFLLYDFAFSKVMSLLQARLVPQLRSRFSDC